MTPERKAQLDAIMQNRTAPTTFSPGTQEPAGTLTPKRKAELDAIMQKRKAPIENKPLSLDQQLERGRKGGAGGFVRDLLKPAGEVATSGFNLLAGTSKLLSGYGAEEANKSLQAKRNIPFLGETKPAFTGEESAGTLAKKIPGYAAELSSFYGGGGAVKGVAEATLKGLAKKGAILGAKEAGISGGLALGGRAAQEDESLGGIAAKTALGTAGGAVLGGTVGAAAPFVRALAKPNAEIIAKQIDSLEDKYIEIATNQQGLKRKLDKAKLKTEWKNKAGTEGTDPARTLAENGIIPKQSGSRLDTFEQANEFRATTDKMRRINRAALEEVDIARPQGVSLEDYKAQAIARARTPQNIDRGVADDLVADIEKSIESYKREYGDFIPVTKLDDIKSARWGDTKFDATKPLKSDVNYTLGKTAQQIIEKEAREAGFEETAQLNRHIGDKLEAAKFLEDLNGKVVKGGRLGKYAMRIIGSGMGQTPLGKILGAFGGDAVANVLISNSIATPMKHRILNSLKIEDPKAYTEALEWLAKNKVMPERLTRTALPAGTARQEARFVNVDGKKVFEPAVEGTPAGQISIPPTVHPSSISAIPGQNQPVIPPEFRSGFTERKPYLPPGVTRKPATNLSPTVQLPNQGVLEGQAMLRGETLVGRKPYLPPSLPPVEGKFAESNPSLLQSLKQDTRGFIKMSNADNLTTKVLQKLEGRETVSKQFISDLTNSGDLKQTERDIIREALKTEGDKVDVAKFADKVKSELLPLKRMSIAKATKNADMGEGGLKYENISLPDELRGNVKNYDENIYRSPIKTSAGRTHFGGVDTGDYFGHTRIEDMADNKTRRVIEVQSDLYQKGNIGKELDNYTQSKYLEDFLPAKEKKELENLHEQKLTYKEKNGGNPNGFPKENRIKELEAKGEQLYYEAPKKREAEIVKLQQYNDPTAHFRMIREEVKKAAQDGKTKLQFPTGKTAMKIEGLGGKETWLDSKGVALDSLDNAEIGSIYTKPNGEKWVYFGQDYNDVHQGVKFEDVKDAADSFIEDGMSKKKAWDEAIADLSGQVEAMYDKVDSDNPIYKFYEKEVGKYLKNKYGANLVTDNNGVTWWELPVKKEYGSQPVEAFGKAMLSPLFVGAGVGLGAVGAGMAYGALKPKRPPSK